MSMFSSLKLLQCSITLLETMGERGLEGGLAGVGSASSFQLIRLLDLLANVNHPADTE